VTDQPDESHPMRDRVDKAISWFTQTDEPDTRTVDERDETPSEARASEVGSAGPRPDVRADERENLAEERAGRSDEPAPMAEAGATGATHEGAPMADETAARTDVGTPPAEGAAVRDERGPIGEPDTRRREEALPAAEDRNLAPERSERVAEENVTPAAAAAVPAAAEGDRAEPAAADERARAHEHERPASWAEVHPNARNMPPEGAIDSEAETAGSRRSLYRDEAPTVAMPAAAAAAAAAGAGVAAAHGEATGPVDAQEAARRRREERAARDRQLGKVIAAPEDSDEPAVTRHTTPTTYRGLPSFGFFVFRLIVAAVLGIRAWQHVTHLSATRATWEATIMPRPDIVAWTQIGLEVVIAIMLVFGLGTRLAGLLLLILSIVSLVFVQWGAVNPFQQGANDFIGVVDVLLTGAGLLFATVGGGRLAIDGAIHSARIQRKNDKLFA
jgi:putative oxidoreductase